MTRPLSVADVANLLQRSPQTRRSILVGGQALNIWAVHFQLKAESAALSHDVDFFGDRKDALAAERDWKGVANIADFDDFTVNAAVVVVEIDDETHGIDFLSSIAGVDSEELRKRAVPVQAEGYEFKVMHPLHVLQSQLENIYGSLRRRDDPHGEYYAGRFALALQVARCSVLELLEAGRTRDALNFAERIGRCALSRAGAKAWQADRLDMLEAIADSAAWPTRFVSKRLPQLREQVLLKRERFARRAE